MTNNGKPKRPPPPKFLPCPLRSRDAITGKTLADEIARTPENRPYLVENLILEKSVTMMAAEPGTGKSCVLATIFCEASVALPVFGQLSVPRPLTTYVFCPERPAYELKERCRKIGKIVPYDVNRLLFDEGMTGLVDLSNPKSIEQIFYGIDRNAPNGIDIFAIEGLYGMTRKPLASEETANMLYRFNARLMSEFDCAIWYNHHTTKKRRAEDGTELPPQWFGSQFIMANVTGAYTLERLPKENYVQLTQNKDTVSGLANKLSLTFDPETFTVRMGNGSDGMGGKEKARRFVNACLSTSKMFTYDDLEAASNLCHSTTSKLIMEWVAERRITNTKPNGHKALYRAEASV